MSRSSSAMSMQKDCLVCIPIIKPLLILTPVVVPIKTLSTSPPDMIDWKDWSEDQLHSFLTGALPLLSDAQAHVMLQLYPFTDPKYWGKQEVGITVQTQRLADLVGESHVQSSVRGISTAYGNNTFNYWFNRVDSKQVPSP